MSGSGEAEEETLRYALERSGDWPNIRQCSPRRLIASSAYLDFITLVPHSSKSQQNETIRSQKLAAQQTSCILEANPRTDSLDTRSFKLRACELSPYSKP